MFNILAGLNAKKEVLKFVRFCLVGSINTLTTYLIIVFLYGILNLDIFISNFSGYIFGLIVSFLFNRDFVFKSKRNNMNTQICKFIVTFVVSYSLNILVLFILNNLIKINSYFSILFSSFFYTLTFYILCNIFVFRRDYKNR